MIKLSVHQLLRRWNDAYGVSHVKDRLLQVYIASTGEEILRIRGDVLHEQELVRTL